MRHDSIWLNADVNILGYSMDTIRTNTISLIDAKMTVF
jgi:hypothetical protein